MIFQQQTAFVGLNAGQEGDRYWANVVSLLHFDGSNGSTSFIDQKGKTWAAQGNAQLSTAWSQFGPSSLALDGTGDYISTAKSADWTFGAGQFTIEATLNLNAPGGGIVTRWGSDGNTATWTFGQDPGGLGLYFYYQGPSNVFDFVSYPSYSPGTGTPVRVAVDRDASGVLRLYVNGTAVASKSIGSLSIVEAAGATAPLIGNQVNGAVMNGYIDEVRVTKGVGRYGGSYTPPTVPFPNS